MQKAAMKLKSINYYEYVKSFIFAIVLAVLFRSFLIEPYSIPSGSMHPTLLEGDYIFSTKYSYGYSRYSFPFGLNIFSDRLFKSQPERGDIIIFRGTRGGLTYIKRLIGLPGDKIQLINKVLYINGKAIPQVYKGTYDNYTMCAYEATACNMYMETLPNGVSYTILQANTDDKPEYTDTTMVYEVPPQHYFFMGDNRSNSIDSRFLKREIAYVPEVNLIARPKYLVLTTDFNRLAQGRFFKEIQ